MQIEHIVDKLNAHLSRNRRRYFWNITILALVSLLLFFVLIAQHNVPSSSPSNSSDWEKYFYAAWAVLSILLGSVVFIQIQEKKVYHTFDSFMNTLISMIKETPYHEHIYILTPNVSLGQTRNRDKFRQYQEALEDAITNRGCTVHFSIWNLETIAQGQKTFSLPGDQPTIETEKHLQYVNKLFGEALLRECGNAKEKKIKNLFLRYEYNNFIDFLTKNKSHIQWHLGGECSEKDLFLLFYNKKRIFVSSCNRIGLISGESIESEGFISSIQEVILQKYFS